MEQQDTVQSLADLGSFAQETTELTINDVTAPYEFRNGMYYCEELDSGFMSLDTLRRAWALKVKAEKIKETRALASGVGKAANNPEHIKEKARKEYRKWQATEIK